MRVNIYQSRNYKVSREVIFLGVAAQFWDILRRSDAGDDPGLGNDRVIVEDPLVGPLKEFAASHMDLLGHHTPLSVELDDFSFSDRPSASAFCAACLR